MTTDPYKKYLLFVVCSILCLRVVTLFMRVPAYAAYYCLQGISHEVKGDLSKSISYYKKAIYHNPSYPRPYLRLGFIYGVKGDKSRKQEYFRKVVQLDPMKHDYARAYNAIGVQYFEKGDYLNAIEHLRKALFLDGDLPEGRYFLGASYYNIGNRPMALLQEKILYQAMQSSTDRSLRGQPWRRKLADLLDLQID